MLNEHPALVLNPTDAAAVALALGVAARVSQAAGFLTAAAETHMLAARAWDAAGARSNAMRAEVRATRCRLAAIVTGGKEAAA